VEAETPFVIAFGLPPLVQRLLTRFRIFLAPLPRFKMPTQRFFTWIDENTACFGKGTYTMAHVMLLFLIDTISI
jgi:hypothetical protein